MNLWKNLDKITTQLQKSPTKVLMLDFDGTLTPIVKSPEQAKLPLKTRGLLQKLIAKPGVYLAIISGRKLSDIKEKISLPNIIYGGNHGLEGEIFGKSYSFPLTNKALSTLNKIKKQLSKVANEFKGVFIEDKDLTLSFHYRLADAQQLSKVILIFDETLRPYLENNSVSIIAGKRVIDVIPKVDWSKGDFAKLVIKEVATRTKEHPTTIAVGDDLTDKDIFQACTKGVTIKVGKNHNSGAEYNLKDINEVFTFIQWMLTANQDEKK